MSVKPNRPHSYADGDNDTLIVEGFEDVWYTVLDENTFKASSYVVPQELMDAATAVSKLADARLSELDEKLQRQYGRIDSQAYKQEYVSRKGGKTLYVTPFITEKLSARHGVDNDDYIWLAMGDGHGREIYGRYKNVSLTPSEYESLKNEYPIYADKYIERLSEYMETKGKSYSNHYATILSWLKKDIKPTNYSCKEGESL